jgi:hypothetical protein
MLNHLLDTFFRAATWRAMHGVSPALAIGLAIAIGAALLWRSRRP